MGRNRVLFRLGADDVSAIRFGVSPGHELALAVRVLLAPAGHPLQWGWLRSLRGRVPPRELELFASLVGPDGYLPDFLTTTPAWDTTPEIEAERLHAVPIDMFVADLELVLAQRPAEPGPVGVRRRATLQRLLAEPDLGRDEVSAGWTTLWDAVLAPHWDQLLRVLNADIALRVRRIAEVGLAATVGDLHDDVSWEDGAVRVEMRSFSTEVECAGSGLVLVPSVMGLPRSHVLTDTEQPTVFYPVHGLTERWQRPRTEASAALSGVLGEGRSRVLLCLDGPLSTSEVAGACDLAVSTASFHLTRLRGAGLVDSRRAGARVLHVRSPIGEALTSGRGEA